MSISSILHSKIIKGGDLNKDFDLKTALEEEPGEMYFNNFAIFNTCALCDKDATDTDASFNYTYKCPYKNVTLYNEVILKMHFGCLSAGIHDFLLNRDRFPKMRFDGVEFHQNMDNMSKIDALEESFDNSKYNFDYTVPNHYECSLYNKFGDDILKSLIGVPK